MMTYRERMLSTLQGRPTDCDSLRATDYKTVGLSLFEHAEVHANDEGLERIARLAREFGPVNP